MLSERSSRVFCTLFLSFTEISDKVNIKHYMLFNNLSLVFAFVNRNWFLISSMTSNWRSNFNACENLLFITEIIRTKSPHTKFLFLGVQIKVSSWFSNVFSIWERKVGQVASAILTTYHVCHQKHCESKGMALPSTGKSEVIPASS